jgi:hypothetical protein
MQGSAVRLAGFALTENDIDRGNTSSGNRGRSGSTGRLQAGPFYGVAFSKYAPDPDAPVMNVKPRES